MLLQKLSEDPFVFNAVGVLNLSLRALRVGQRYPSKLQRAPAQASKPTRDPVASAQPRASWRPPPQPSLDPGVANRCGYARRMARKRAKEKTAADDAKAAKNAADAKAAKDAADAKAAADVQAQAANAERAARAKTQAEAAERAARAKS